MELGSKMVIGYHCDPGRVKDLSHGWSEAEPLVQPSQLVGPYDCNKAEIFIFGHLTAEVGLILLSGIT